MPFDLIAAGTSFATAELAALVEEDDVLEPELDVVFVVVDELLPHAAIAPMHSTKLGATNQFLQLPNGPPPYRKQIGAG